MSLLILVLGHSLNAAPNGVDVADQSNVAWTTPIWADDGTGAMPIGNGDATSSVWVDPGTGDLRLLLSKSDVFDESGQPVKTGVLRLSFNPPLWANPKFGIHADPSFNCSVFGCTCQGESDYFGIVSGNGFGCTTPADQDWWKANHCHTTPKTGGNCGGQGCKAPHSAPCVPDGPPSPGPPPPPPPPTPPTGYLQTLVLANSTVVIATEHVTVKVYFDLNAAHRDGVAHLDAAILHVTATATGVYTPGDSSAGFGLKVALEPYRVEGAPSKLGAGLCFPAIEHADIVSTETKDSIIWYHYNAPNNTNYYSSTVQNQGVDPKLGTDVFSARSWGGSVAAEGLVSGSDATGLTIAGTGLSTVDVTVSLLTLEPAEVASPQTWLTEIGKITPAPPATPTAPASCDVAHMSQCTTTWDEVMSRSFIEVTASNPSPAASWRPHYQQWEEQAKQITDHVNWDRYLSLIQGRTAYAPIKFNGQAFNCNNTGKGWDARDWGAAYWWQNTRQPYYNVLQQGDIDTSRAFLNFYLRQLPLVEARTTAQFRNTSMPITAGALFEETATQFGMYEPNGNLGWGCNSPIPRPNGAGKNTYIRFHFTGALELSLMVLDHYTATQSMPDLERYLPIAVSVVEGFRQRWTAVNKATGKLDHWPSQALETYQCPDPTSRTSCPTDASTDIAGLASVLPRLIALPATATTPALVARWKAHLALLPALPTGPAKTQNGPYSPQKLLPATAGAPRRHNSENTELYAVHPFRLFGTGKLDLALAQQSYLERPSPCNDGWCQDCIQAAMLNLTVEANAQLVQRAAQPPAAGFRFGGFAAHYQDYEPSLDHFAFMRTGLDYMLMSPLDDAKQSMLLFPTFNTTAFNVRFKLHAPLNTIIEASCQDGKLEYLIVTPPSRRADITVMNCA